MASLDARREAARVQTFCAVLYAPVLVLTMAAAGLKNFASSTQASALAMACHSMLLK